MSAIHTAGTFPPGRVFAIKHGRVAAELAGGGAVHQIARIGRAHLEEDPHLEIAHRLPIEPAIGVVVGIAPDQRVNADAWTLAQDCGQLFAAPRPRSSKL